MHTQSTSIFISYARKDGAQLAQRLRDDLSANGYDAWLDTSRLLPGASWSAEIEAAVDRADIFLAILSSGSYVSDVCRGEQLRALRRGKRVIPLLLDEEADRPVFLESAQFVSFTSAIPYPDAWTRLQATLQSTQSASLVETFTHTYVTAPRVPRHVVERPDELRILRERILRDEPSDTMEAIALTGMGGLGKTTLALMLCHDSAIQNAFPEGIIWLNIGRETTELVPKLREVGRALGDDPKHFDTLEGSTNRLRTMLPGKAVLLILDDIWDLHQVEPFLVDSPTSRLLITTRHQEIALTLHADRIAPATLTDSQSLEVLARWTGIARSILPVEARTIVRECGRLPLALSMIGGLIRSSLTKGRADAWASVLNRLQNAEIDRIRFPLENYPYEELQRAIQISVDELDGPDQQRYLDMAIFPEDTPVPESVLQTFWGVDSDRAQDTIDKWLDGSLATRNDKGGITIHDLQLDYVRKISVSRLGVLHSQFIDSYAKRYQHEWPAVPSDGYFYQHIAEHMAAAERWRELAHMLVSPQFVRAKLDASSYSSYLELLLDFRWREQCLDAIEDGTMRAAFVDIESHAKRLRSFRNRAAETAAIEAWLDDVNGLRHLVITGAAGFGKTILIQHLLFRSRRERHFLILNQRSLWSFDDFLERFLQGLRQSVGVDVHIPAIYQAGPPWDNLPPQHLARLLSEETAGRLHQPVCVILDDVNHGVDVSTGFLFPFLVQRVLEFAEELLPSIRFIWAARVLPAQFNDFPVYVVDLHGLPVYRTHKWQLF
jgi:NB-ARC domain/TIR domain/APAF-1 helical domain